MPAPFDFPGHYWDEDRQRFFKIEKTGTAPEGSSWSQDHVRVRSEHEKAQQRKKDRQRQRRDRRVRPSHPAAGGAAGAAAASRYGSPYGAPYGSPSSAAAAVPDGADANDDDDEDMDPLTFPPRIARPSLYENPLIGGFLSRETKHEGAGPHLCQQPLRPVLAATATAAYAQSLCCHGWMTILDDSHAQQEEEEEEGYGGGGGGDHEPQGFAGQPLQLARGRARIPSPYNVKCMYVHGGDDATGLGVVYTSVPDEFRTSDLKAQYIPRDANNCLVEEWPTNGPFARYARFERTRTERMHVPSLSALAYHKPSHHMIATESLVSRTDYGGIEGSACIQIFSPRTGDADPDDPGPAWRVGGTVSGPGVNRRVLRVFGDANGEDAVYACAPAPAAASSSLLCVVGSSRGIATIDLQRLTLATTRAGAQRAASRNVDWYQYRAGTDLFLRDYALRSPYSYDGSSSNNNNHNNRKGRRGKNHSNNNNTVATPPLVISTVDFFEGHPSLVLAGGRGHPHPWLVDLRESGGDDVRRWHAFHSAGSGASSSAARDASDRCAHGAMAHTNAAHGVARVRSVGQYRVVAAGVRDTMLLYDVRNLGMDTATTASSSSLPSSSSSSLPTGNPLLRFQGYRNNANIMGVAFDVEPSLGLVATVDDDGLQWVHRPGQRPYCMRRSGGLVLFSLATGERLEPNQSLQRDGLSQPYDPAAGLPPETRGTSLAALKPRPNRERLGALQFARLPGDKVSSLFVAVGPRITKLSPGMFGEDGEPENEGDNSDDDRGDKMVLDR